MSLFNYFQTQKKSSASVAKERLKIIVAHERSRREQPDFIPELQNEILQVISKYFPIDREQVSMKLDNDNNHSVLEVNITLPNDTMEP